MSLNYSADFAGAMPKPAGDGTVPESLKCAKCQNLLYNAMLVQECGCRLCETPCLAELFAGGRTEAMCPGGTEDCTIFSHGLADKGTRRNVLNLNVTCIYGCGHVCIFRDLSSHLRNCPRLPTVCTFCHNTFPLCEIKKHMDQCPDRVITCELCTEDITAARYSDHLNLLSDSCCVNFTGPCPHCNIGRFTRSDMIQHKTECEKWPVECPFRKVGCNFEGTDLSVHMNDNVPEHQQLLLESVVRKQEIMNQENENLRQENAKLRQRCTELTSETNNLKTEFNERWKKMRKVQTMLANCREKQIDIDKTVEKYGTVESLLSRFQEADVSSRPRQHAIPQIEPGVTTYDGVFLWRIDNYRARRTEAKEGTTLTLTSPPFFTEPYGYKMCCRLYLNGDGSGRGTHMSLFIVLMKSDYDSILKWPFSNRVTFTLLDQENSVGNVVETFSPDQRSNSFRRPVDDMNIASGCPRFILFSRLEGHDWRSPYLRDDTLFIRTVVEKTSLH